MTERSTIPLTAPASSESDGESIADRLTRLTREIGRLAADTRANVEATRAAWDAAVAESFEVEVQATRLRAEIRSAGRPRVQGRVDFAPRPLRDGSAH